MTTRPLSFAYDASSRMTSAADPAAAYVYAYDDLDRRTSVTHDLAGLSFNVDVISAYNASGDRTQLKAMLGVEADFVNDYVYDGLHRLTQVEQHDVTDGNAVAEKRVDFTYDAASRFDIIRRYEDLAGAEHVATSNYDFDLAGRLTELVHAATSVALADYAWTYDQANRVISFNNEYYPNDNADYTYDAASQLTFADRDTDDETYSYDDNGNRDNAGYDIQANNHLRSDGVYNYDYDLEGNRTKRIQLVNGSPSGATTEYEWDYHNRLTKITERNAPADAATKVFVYTYDVFGRRISKSIDLDAAGPTAPTVTYFIHDGERHERGNAGDHIVLALDAEGDVANRYLHGPLVDQVLADEQVTSASTPGNVLWPLADDLGTVRDLVDYNATTNAAVVVNHLTYGAFGNITAETNAAIDHFFAFTGRERDEESGLQQNRERPYDPLTGRFLSEDPIYDDYANPYRYVGNNSTGRTDPSGREWWEIPVAGLAGVGQGGLNTANGLQDAVIGASNLPAMGVNGIAWLEERIGALDHSPGNQMRLPYIPSPDWSRGLIVEESDACHGWSKFLGAFGVELLVGAKGAGNLSKAGRAGTLADEGATLVDEGATLINEGAATRQLLKPQTDPSLIGTNTLGYTTANGDVFLQPGLSRAQQAATLRHEGVHSFLSVADDAPLAGVRQRVGVGAYNNSAFFNATEETLAECIASGSLRQGIRHAFNGAYVVRPGTVFETVVTRRSFTIELGVGATGLGASGYGAYQIGGQIFGGNEQ